MMKIKFLVAARGDREDDFANTRDGEIVTFVAARSRRGRARAFTGIETRMATTVARVVALDIDGGVEAIARRDAEGVSAIQPPYDETVAQCLANVQWLQESIADFPVGTLIRVALGEMWRSR